VSVHADRLIADLIVVNANIFTGDPLQPRAEALAVQGEIIVAIGSDEDVRRLTRPETRVIDAEGRLIVPGFNDAHVHFIAGAEELVGVDLRPSRDEGDLAARLERYAATRPSGEWITGGYWDHEAWPGSKLPTRAAIDAVTPNHPVFVKRLDGHMALANTVAMRRAGISDEMPVPPGGAAVRDARGQLTGLFKDTAMDLVTGAIPPATLDTILQRARAALEHAAALGVTSVQDMTASATELAAYEALYEAGELTTRISSIQMYEGERRLEKAGNSGRGDWLSSGGRKFFADGSMGASTAAFFEPYTDDPATSGLLIHDPDRLEQLIVDADAAGVQPVVHAIGDRANALVLDILERRYAARGISRRWRPRIEHAQVVRPEDRARYRALGVVVSIQPSHAIDDMRWAEARIGTERSAMAYNVRSFVDAGAHVAFGTDWFVAPLDPMVGLYAAVTRQFRDGTPPEGWFPDERITLVQAVDCYTRGSAHAQFAEDRKGTLKRGFLADFVMLSRNIFEIPAREILETRPVLTVVGGRVVFEAARSSIPNVMAEHRVTSESASGR
jgi:predicted amidohydrolase YtcJ